MSADQIPVNLIYRDIRNGGNSSLSGRETDWFRDKPTSIVETTLDCLIEHIYPIYFTDMRKDLL